MDIAAYRHILAECFPQLQVSNINFIGGGTFRVFQVEVSAASDSAVAFSNSVAPKQRLIFRFPHGGEGHELLQRERRVCEALAPCLPTPIPYYQYHSEGCQTFPRAVAGYHLLPGLALQDCKLDQGAMQTAAKQIGAFLSILHKVCPSTIQAVGVPQFTPAQMLERQQELYAEIRRQAFKVLNAEEQAWTERLFTSFLADTENWHFEAVVSHGDLDGSNILCDPKDGTLLGIIDFEEACLGDPACDFCVLSAEYGPAFLETLLDAYGQLPDASFKARIAFHGQRVLFHELLYGLEEGEPRFIEHGLMRLRRAMSGQEPTGGWLVASTAESRSVEGYPS